MNRTPPGRIAASFKASLRPLLEPWSRPLSRRCGLLVVLILLLSLSGCELIFTTSPLSFLQRDPANLPPAQRIAWAEQALASGDPAAMAAAYAVIKDQAASSSDPELTYLAAMLALELSGAPAMLMAVLSGSAEFTSAADVEEVFASVDTAYLSEAGGFFQATHDNDGSFLSGTDYILGCMCLLFEAVETNSGNAAGADYSDLNDFALDGQTAVGADDPAYDTLQELKTLSL